jgi:hypothetical protein
MKCADSINGAGWPIVAALAALLVSYGPSTASATQTSSATTWLLADANKRFNVSGVVQSISYVTNTVRLNEGNQSIEITITPTTAIEVRGESGSIADIRRGSKITATGVIRSGDWVANSVVVR